MGRIYFSNFETPRLLKIKRYTIHVIGLEQNFPQKRETKRITMYFSPLNTKRRLLYLKTQFVPRSKHFSSLL